MTSSCRARKGPRTGSSASQALRQLHQNGGCSNINDWMILVSWTAAMGVFNRQVLGPLLQFKLIEKRGPLFVVTEIGRAYLGVAAEAAAPQVITPAPYVAPMRPLSARHMPSIRVMRPGALDYKAIPSRMGDLLIPHGAKAAA